MAVWPDHHWPVIVLMIESQISSDLFLSKYRTHCLAKQPKLKFFLHPSKIIIYFKNENCIFWLFFLLCYNFYTKSKIKKKSKQLQYPLRLHLMLKIVYFCLNLNKRTKMVSKEKNRSPIYIYFSLRKIKCNF